MRALTAVAMATATLVACSGAAPPQSQSQSQSKSQSESGEYDGRAIAQTMSYRGADWLDRPDRAAREQPDRVLDALALTPGMAVADVGAGTGYFTLRLAQRVGSAGAVYATDLQPEMLQLLAARLAAAGVHNVTLVRATDHDAALPPASVDLVLLVDVYHELADPPAVMSGIRRALRGRGRLVLVEYRGEDPEVAIKPEHKMTLAQIQKELGELGFHFEQSLEFLPDQRVVIFTRADA